MTSEQFHVQAYDSQTAINSWFQRTNQQFDGSKAFHLSCAYQKKRRPVFRTPL